ncbi:hypothetical protein MMYC01_202244 [Madurella mycetomatis]|uniref:Uncharacterized protein n=1 Tax=Madurella mycetomatis TaxID=100816 RepID=A0A175WCD0_9PEZI|nr:hypothetical protein MMYC01_202244 [Madurella mycetomatis]
MTSHLFARTALRTAARTAFRRQQLQHMQQQKPFSIIHSLRSFARSFEPHPFERLPVASRPAPADWSRIVKRVGGQAAIYFPGIFLLLGWPYAGKVLLDGSI